MPEWEEPENRVFNNQVSMVRIRSEHAIWYLKGRFQSLKGLHVKIQDETTHRIATYWVVACIILHAFAMFCEAEEREMEGLVDYDVQSLDPFVNEGLSSSSSSDENAPQLPQGRNDRLRTAKRFREQLKSALLRHKERQRQNK